MVKNQGLVWKGNEKAQMLKARWAKMADMDGWLGKGKEVAAG